MAKIGTFKQVSGEFRGAIATLTLSAKSVRIVPEADVSGSAPDHRVFVGDVEVGAAWDKRTQDGRAYLSVKLDEARDAGRATSRAIFARPYEILTFIGRGTGKDHYERLRAALDRLQSTTIATSIRQQHQRRRHRFSWINEWRETVDADGRATGIEMILPDWFYAGVLDRALILTIDPAYFALTGGVERWLYRLVRKHGGHQRGGWSFDLAHLHLKSGVLSPLKQFAFEVRAIVARQSLPGYDLSLARSPSHERLIFKPRPIDLFDLGQRRLGRSRGSGAS